MDFWKFDSGDLECNPVRPLSSFFSKVNSFFFEKCSRFIPKVVPYFTDYIFPPFLSLSRDFSHPLQLFLFIRFLCPLGCLFSMISLTLVSRQVIMKCILVSKTHPLRPLELRQRWTLHLWKISSTYSWEHRGSSISPSSRWCEKTRLPLSKLQICAFFCLDLHCYLSLSFFFSFCSLRSSSPPSVEESLIDWIGGVDRAASLLLNGLNSSLSHLEHSFSARSKVLVLRAENFLCPLFWYFLH